MVRGGGGGEKMQAFIRGQMEVVDARGYIRARTGTHSISTLGSIPFILLFKVKTSRVFRVSATHRESDMSKQARGVCTEPQQHGF